MLVDDVLVLLNDLLRWDHECGRGIVELIERGAGVDIPILSALWKAMTGNDLTFLDLICCLRDRHPHHPDLSNRRGHAIPATRFR